MSDTSYVYTDSPFGQWAESHGAPQAKTPKYHRTWKTERFTDEEQDAIAKVWNAAHRRVLKTNDMRIIRLSESMPNHPVRGIAWKFEDLTNADQPRDGITPATDGAYDAIRRLTA